MSKTKLPDTYFMQEALKEARKALEKEEVPIGAVIVCKNQIVARGFNQVELLHDVTAHAEILAITSAENHFQTKYLTDCEIYVTLEPCAMCASAIGWAQIKKLIYGAADDKKGFTKFSDKILHPKCKIEKGIMKEECSELLKQFFMKKRR